MFKKALMIGTLAVAAMLVSESTAEADHCYSRYRSAYRAPVGIPVYGVGHSHLYRSSYRAIPYRSYRPSYGYGYGYGRPSVGFGYSTFGGGFGPGFYPGYGRGGISIGFGF